MGIYCVKNYGNDPLLEKAGQREQAESWKTIPEKNMIKCKRKKKKNIEKLQKEGEDRWRKIMKSLSFAENLYRNVSLKKNQINCLT